MLANFRDLGGLPLKNNRVIKKGVFFRSAMLDHATDEELAMLKEKGIKVAFDLRNKSENRGERPYDMIGAEHRNIPATYKNSRLFRLDKGGIFTMLFREITWEDVAETYSSLPVGNKAYHALMKSVVENEVPLLMHCSAGKDRAGISTAIIMLLLGAEYETVLEEYMRSREAQAFNEYVIGEILPKFIHKFAFKHFEAFFKVYPELLDTSLNKIKEVYGDYETYFEKEFGITQEIREQLIERYTEPAPNEA